MMLIADVPQDVLELVERRISERVQERVQRRLNWIYTTIVAGAIGGGGVGIYAVAQETTRTVVQDVVNRDLIPVSERAQLALAEAEEAALRAQLRIEQVDEALERVDAQTHAAEQGLANTERNMARAKKDLDGLSTHVGGLDATIEDFKARMNDSQAQADDQLKTLRVASADVATLYASIAKVSALAEHVRVLDGIVQALAEGELTASPAQTSRLAELSKSLKPIAKSIRSQSDQLRDSGRLTLFFQFADMSPPLARSISTRLRDTRRYLVPGEVRERMQSGLREVRYFARADQAEAQQLADDTTAALAEVGLRDITVEVKALDWYQGRKPRPRTLELWLSLPGATLAAAPGGI